MLLLHAGSEYLKAKVAPSCLKGEKVICLAISEPYAGSDVANIRCTAELDPTGQFFVVNGEKKWITNGTFADYFTVAVRGACQPRWVGGETLRLRAEVDTRTSACEADGPTYLTTLEMVELYS